ATMMQPEVSQRLLLRQSICLSSTFSSNSPGSSKHRAVANRHLRAKITGGRSDIIEFRRTTERAPLSDTSFVTNPIRTPDDLGIFKILPGLALSTTVAVIFGKTSTIVGLSACSA